MHSTTAASSAVTRLRDPSYDLSLSHRALRGALYVRLNRKQYERPKVPRVSIDQLKVELKKPVWLAAVTRRIRASVARSGSDDQTTISQAIVEASLQFFDDFSDLLSHEPYIYSSTQGDLVAEFRTGAEKITAIISTEFFIIFGVVHNEPINLRFLRYTSSNQVRKKIREKFAGIDGKVAAR